MSLDFTETEHLSIALSMFIVMTYGIPREKVGPGALFYSNVSLGTCSKKNDSGCLIITIIYPCFYLPILWLYIYSHLLLTIC